MDEYCCGIKSSTKLALTSDLSVPHFCPVSCQAIPSRRPWCVPASAAASDPRCLQEFLVVLSPGPQVPNTHTHTHESRVGPLPSARSGEKQPQTRRLGDRPNRAGAHTSSSSNGWPLKYLNCCLNYTLGISHDHQWIMMVRLQAFSKNSDKQFLPTVTGHGILCISKNQTG